jgi:hypothetical protein
LKGEIAIKLILGEEHVIVRGIRPEEQLWGPYQFPRPYHLDDRLVVSVHVANDDIKSSGMAARWFESRSKGATWREIDDSVSAQCGLLLQNGDRIYFPLESGICLDHYKLPPHGALTPDYDFGQKAEEDTLPYPDGITCWWIGVVIRAYQAERLPDSLSKKEWQTARIYAGETEPVFEKAQVEWPYLTRVVYSAKNYNHVLKPIYPRGTPKIGPDGAIWVSAFSGEGHINPKTGMYSPYYSAELFRSDDNGRTFKQRAHMEYEADGHQYPYQSGGFSDSDFEFMPDGSIVWFFRTAWFVYTGIEWSPMYMSRSTDNGLTWSNPAKFSDAGILPRLCKLECGITLLCYARPGMYICASEDESGTEWSQPIVAMEPGDRSHLHNVKVGIPNFHEWVGSCCNPELLAIDSNTALLFYSDFYYPDNDGVKRKTILCRTVTVEKD